MTSRDAALDDSSREADETSFRSLGLGRHERWLRAVIRAWVGEAQAVDDVLQEVAVAAAGSTGFGGGALASTSRAPWLYGTAVRQALLYRRKAARRRRLTEGFVREVKAGSTIRGISDPLDLILAKERGEMVRRAVEALPGKDAEVLLLKYTEDWSYREIADHMGLSASAVEARLHRARRRFREELARGGAIEERP